MESRAKARLPVPRQSLFRLQNMQPGRGVASHRGEIETAPAVIFPRMGSSHLPAVMRWVRFSEQARRRSRGEV